MNIVSSILAPYKMKLSNWWHSFNEQQRSYLSVMIVFIIIFLGYYLVVSPINNSIASLQQQLSYQQSVLRKIQPQINEISHLKTNSTSSNAISASNLLTTVDQSLKSHGLSSFTSEVSQSGSSGVQIKFANVPFDQLTTWLVSLWTNYHIQVSRIDVQHTDTLGNVNILLTLSN